MNLSQIQREQKLWSEENFGTHPSWHPLLGLVEEVGELSHHFLKRAQGIRNNENHDYEILDAIGDIMIYLMDFCNCEDINLLTATQITWSKVSKRDWKLNPDSAHKEG